MLSDIAVMLALCLYDHLAVVSYIVLGMLARAHHEYRRATPSPNLDRNPTYMYTPTVAYSLSALIGLVVGIIFVVVASPALPVVLARRKRRDRPRRQWRGRQVRRPLRRHRARSRFRLRGGDASLVGMNRAAALREVTRSVRRVVSILEERSAAEEEVEQELSFRVRADGGFDQFFAELCELDDAETGEPDDEQSEVKHVPPEQQLSARTHAEGGWDELCAELCDHGDDEAREERPEQTGGGEEEDEELPDLPQLNEPRDVAVLALSLTDRAGGSLGTVHARILGASFMGVPLAEGVIAGADCVTLHVPGAADTAGRPGNSFFIHRTAGGWVIDEDLRVEQMMEDAGAEKGPLGPTDVTFIAPPQLMTWEETDEHGKPKYTTRGGFALHSTTNEMHVVFPHETEPTVRMMVRKDDRGAWNYVRGDGTGQHVHFGARVGGVGSPRSELRRQPLEACSAEELREARSDAVDINGKRKVRRRGAVQSELASDSPPLLAPTNESEPSMPPAEAEGVPNSRPLFEDTQASEATLPLAQQNEPSTPPAGAAGVPNSKPLLDDTLSSNATPPLGQTGPEEAGPRTSQPASKKAGAEEVKQTSEGGKTRPTPKMKGTGSPLGEKPRLRAHVDDDEESGSTSVQHDAAEDVQAGADAEAAEAEAAAEASATGGQHQQQHQQQQQQQPDDANTHQDPPQRGEQQHDEHDVHDEQHDAQEDAARDRRQDEQNEAWRQQQEADRRQEEHDARPQHDEQQYDEEYDGQYDEEYDDQDDGQYDDQDDGQQDDDQDDGQRDGQHEHHDEQQHDAQQDAARDRRPDAQDEAGADTAAAAAADPRAAEAAAADPDSTQDATNDARQGDDGNDGGSPAAGKESPRRPTTRSTAAAAAAVSQAAMSAAIAAAKEAEAASEKKKKSAGKASPKKQPDASRPAKPSISATQTVDVDAQPTQKPEAAEAGVAKGSTKRTTWSSARLSEQSGMPAMQAGDKPGVGCWWFAAYPLLTLVKQGMKKPAWVSKTGDPVLYIEVEGFRVVEPRGKNDGPIKWSSDEGALFVSLRGKGGAGPTREERIMETRRVMDHHTVLGAIFYDEPHKDNGYEGHFWTAYPRAEGGSMKERNRPDPRPFAVIVEEGGLKAGTRVDLLLVKRPEEGPTETPQPAGAAVAAQAPPTSTEGAAHGKPVAPAAAPVKVPAASAPPQGSSAKAPSGKAPTAMPTKLPTAAPLASQTVAGTAASPKRSRNRTEVPLPGQTETVPEAQLPWRTNIMRSLPKNCLADCRKYFISTFEVGVRGFFDASKCLTRPGRNRGTQLSRQLKGATAPAPERIERADHTSDTLKVKRAEEAARRGHWHRAVTTLFSEDVHIKPSECKDVKRELVGLHPAAEKTDVMRQVQVAKETIIVTSSEVLAAAKKMARGDAPGASGLTSDVLAQVLTFEDEIGGNELQDLVAALVTQMLKNDIPGDVARGMRQIRLVPLAKRRADGSFKGVRPVAMSETMLKLAANIALMRHPHYGAFWDYQYGMKRGGVEEAIFKVQDAVRAGKWVRTFDATNAYNTLRRDSFFRNMETSMDDGMFGLLKAYTNFVYGGSSTATYEDESGDLHRIEVHTGVRQGDPCGPLLFCLGIQPVLEKVASSLGVGVEVIAYLDDIALIFEDGASAELVKKTTDLLVTEMKAIGLVLRVESDSKGVEDFRYLGAAITRDETKTSEALRKHRPLAPAQKFAETIVPMDRRISTELLRVCGVSRGGFVARTHGAAANAYLTEFDAITTTALSQILVCGRGWIEANQMIQRAASLGGYGMTMWAKISAACHQAARSKKPQWQVLLDKHKPEDVVRWKREGEGRVSPAALNGVARPLTGEQHAAFVKEECGLPHAPVKVLTAAGKLHCLGCHGLFDAADLLRHTPQCAKVPGPGNVSRRHDEAKLSLLNICRENKMPAQAEVRLRKEATTAGAPAQDLFMDLVVGIYGIDITVTRRYMHQLKDKTKKYATTLAQEGLKLRVLAFTPTGRIHPESLLFARGLAKQAGKPFDEFWAPVCTEVIRGTMKALIEARNRIYNVAEQTRNNAIEARASESATPAPSAAPSAATAPAVLATVPAPHNTSSPAQDTTEADAHMDVMAEFGSAECVDIANIGAAASDDSEGEE